MVFDVYRILVLYIPGKMDVALSYAFTCVGLLNLIGRKILKNEVLYPLESNLNLS